jgi:hypothetical protein
VNPVNTMYAALPALLYVNASIVPYLLGPLLDYQSSSAYTNTFAAPDLGMFRYLSGFLWMDLRYVIQGTTYPTALGNNTNTILGAIESKHLGLLIILHFIDFTASVRFGLDADYDLCSCPENG